MLTLHSARASAAIDLDGGRLASLIIDGHEIMVTEGDRPTRWGSFPMIPWCGRLDHGRFTFDDVEYQMPITSAPHANHGRAHLQMWELDGTATIRTALAVPWPFGGFATQEFVLTDTALTIAVTVGNNERSMPAMAGWHPWFRRQLTTGGPAKLHFDADAIYETNTDDIPTGGLADIPPKPWNACFVGVSNGPLIEWPGALTIALSSSFEDWVIFTEPDQALCVEPQSGLPNEFNIEPFVVSPGEPLHGSMTISW